jgi:hypothetical protein
MSVKYVDNLILLVNNMKTYKLPVLVVFRYKALQEIKYEKDK